MSLEGHLNVAVSDDAVQFIVTVTNPTTEPIEVTFPSGLVVDVIVTAIGVEEWRWSEGRMFTQAMQTETIAPGKSFKRERIWPDPPSGSFTARVSLETTPPKTLVDTLFTAP